MNAKASSFLEKASRDRARGDFKGALTRLAAGISECPGEVSLYREGLEVALEAGESRQASQFFKKAWRRLPRDREELWAFAIDKTNAYNDAVLATFLLDAAVRDRNFDAAEDAVGALKDHTALELLTRARTKQQTLTNAMSGDESLADELVAHLLAEIVLAVRTSRYKEATQTLLKLMEDKPEENDVLLPFLQRLEKRDRDNSAVAFALGCASLRAQHWKRGIDHLVHSAVRDKEYTNDALELLTALQQNDAVAAVEVDLALARIQLFLGNSRAVVEHVERIMDVGNEKASELIAILDPQRDEIGDDTTLDYLFIDVALSAGRTERALAHIKKVYRVRRHRAELLARLQERQNKNTLPDDVLYYFGEIALAEGMHEQAIRAFRSVMHQTPHEVVRIRETITRYCSNPSIQRFFNEIKEGDTTPEETTTDGFEISHYEASEFKFGDKPAPPTESDGEPEAPDTSPFDDPDRYTPPRAFEDGGSRAPQSDVPEGRSPFDDGFAREDRARKNFSLGETDGTEEDKLGEGFSIDGEKTPFGSVSHDAPAHDNTWIDRGSPTLEQNPGTEHNDETWDTEGIVSNTPPVISLGSGPSQKTGADGPQQVSKEDMPWNNAEADTPSALEELAAADEPPAPGFETPGAEFEAPVAPHAAPPPPPSDEPPRDEYETLSESFARGELKGADALRLSELAVERGDTEAARCYLDFEPENVGQEITRKQLLAEYYVRVDRPQSALIILKTIHLDTLGREQKQRLLLLIAYCYKMLNRFDAAQSVYLRLLGEGIDSAAIEQMAEANRHRYLNEITGAAPVLEKVLTL